MALKNICVSAYKTDPIFWAYIYIPLFKQALLNSESDLTLT